MKYPKEIVLVRHGESQGNTLAPTEHSIFNLNTKDYPLTEKGEKQAKKAGEYLKNKYKKFDAIFASYCRRTQDSIKIMFPEKEFREDSRVAEVQRGVWHTMTPEEVNENFPYEERRRKKEGLYYYRPLGGENWPDLEIRIYNFLEYLCREYAGKRVLVCVHGHWLIVFQRILHGFSIEEALRRYKECVSPNGSITVYKNKRGTLQLEKESFLP